MNSHLHSAPAVGFPVGRSRFEAWVSALAWLAGAATCGGWLWQASPWGWRQGLGVALVLGTGTWAWRAWHASTAAVLRWDGQNWWRETGQAAQTGRVAVHLDFQNYLLLSLSVEPGSRDWFWLERRAAPPGWNALRRAAYSQAGRNSPKHTEERTPDGELGS